MITQMSKLSDKPLLVSEELQSAENLNKTAEDEEKKRFVSRSPLKTLLYMAIGPLMFNTGISFHDAVDLILIGHAIGGDSIQIVGFSSLIRYLCMCVTIYFAQSTIAKIASLLGAGERELAGQVITDLYRVSIISVILVSVMFYFCTEPMMMFMQCTPEMAKEARDYMLPILAGMPFIALFQLSCGFLQSQGRSVFCGGMQILAFALNCGVFTPTLLYGLKVPLKYAGLGFVFAEAIPGIVLTILIFKGKFNIDPSLKNFTRCVSKETMHALLLGTPYIVNILMGALPPMILLRYMMVAAGNSGQAAIVGALWSVFLKLQSAVNSVSIGVNQGLVAAGSYARGAGDWGRLLRLGACSAAVTLAYHLCWIPLMEARGDWVARIWITDAEQIAASRAFLRIPFYTNFLIPLDGATASFLIASGKPVRAMIPSLVRGVACLSATFALFFTGKDDPVRMMHTYNINDAAVFLTDIALVLGPIIEARRKANT